MLRYGKRKSLHCCWTSIFSWSFTFQNLSQHSPPSPRLFLGASGNMSCFHRSSKSLIFAFFVCYLGRNGVSSGTAWIWNEREKEFRAGKERERNGNCEKPKSNLVTNLGSVPHPLLGVGGSAMKPERDFFSFPNTSRTGTERDRGVGFGSYSSLSLFLIQSIECPKCGVGRVLSNLFINLVIY